MSSNALNNKNGKKETMLANLANMAKINDNFATIANKAKHKAMKWAIKIIEMWAKETFLALNKRTSDSQYDICLRH